MKQVKAVVPIFSILLILSLLILFFFQNPLSAVLQTLTLPLQEWAFSMSVKPIGTLTPQQLLQQENNKLRTELAQMQEIKKDNQALNDQFKTTSPSPQKLLPADVIGIQQSSILINKGSSDSLHLGDVVVVKDNLIGKIIKLTPYISQVALLNDPTTSFTAQTTKTSANGIVRALDSGTIILANVILSDKLEINDMVETKGDLDLQGHGFPPHLIVGKIISVDKQASSLFQAAKIQSLVDISQLRMVFVLSQ